MSSPDENLPSSQIKLCNENEKGVEQEKLYECENRKDILPVPQCLRVEKMSNIVYGSF